MQVNSLQQESIIQGMSLMRLHARSVESSIIALLCASLLALGGVGCDAGASIGKTVPVAGKVTVAGQPLTTGSVAFKPDGSKGNNSKFEPASTIGSDGSYQLITNGKSGAPPGWYKVTVVAEEEVDSINPIPKSKINAKYKDPQNTPLSIEVKEGAAPDAYDLKLTR